MRSYYVADNFDARTQNKQGRKRPYRLQDIIAAVSQRMFTISVSGSFDALRKPIGVDEFFRALDVDKADGILTPEDIYEAIHQNHVDLAESEILDLLFDYVDVNFNGEVTHHGTK